MNHGSPEAEQKMKEINEAYDMIVNHKYNPGGAGQGGYGGGFGGMDFDNDMTPVDDGDMPF